MNGWGLSGANLDVLIRQQDEAHLMVEVSVTPTSGDGLMSVCPDPFVLSKQVDIGAEDVMPLESMISAWSGTRAPVDLQRLTEPTVMDDGLRCAFAARWWHMVKR